MDGSGLPTKRNRKFIPARQRQDHQHPIQHFRFVKPAPGKTDATSQPLQPNVTDIDSEPPETVIPANPIASLASEDRDILLYITFPYLSFSQTFLKIIMQPLFQFFKKFKAVLVCPQTLPFFDKH